MTSALEKKIYSTEKISEHIYKISELELNNSFLITGNKKAMLVDCGVGISKIGDEVKKITSLPVFLVATHAHADHIGGAREWGKVYIHRSDLPIARYSNSLYQRTLFLNKHGFLDEMKKNGEKLPLYKPYLFIKTFKSGKIFDLGGLEVEAINTPGHSVGSCIFKIPQDNVVLVGDNFIPMLFLHYGFAASLSEWLKGCELMLEKSEGCVLYGGHGRNNISREGILWQYEKAKEIVSKTEKNDNKKNKKTLYVFDKKHKHLLIKYRTDKIINEETKIL